MAFFSFNNVRVAGMSAGVPVKKICNLKLTNLSKDYDAEAFVETTGILERRVDDLTTSDLCIPAAEKLIADLGWDKSEITVIIFVSQTTDYYLPATACIIQIFHGYCIFHIITLQGDIKFFVCQCNNRQSNK